MRFQVKMVDNYPPVYDIKLAPPTRNMLNRAFRYAVWMISMFAIGWLFPNQTNAILNKIPFSKKD